MTVRNDSKISIVSIILSENQPMRVETIKDEEKLYLDPIEKSVLSIRGKAREPKHLVVGALWDNILVDSMQVSIKVTGK
jgi:hypothetical protein